MDPTYYNRLFRHNSSSDSISSIPKNKGDRLIPVRDTEHTEHFHAHSIGEKKSVSGIEYNSTMIKQEARQDYSYDALFQTPRPTEKDPILRYTHTIRPVRTILEEHAYQEERAEELRRKLENCTLSIDTSCYKTLDMPGISSDFYTNLLDVSADNVLATALGDKTYLFRGESSTGLELGNGDSVVSCVHWIAKKQALFTGFDDGRFTIFDATTRQNIPLQQEGAYGITCAASGSSPHVVYYGSKGDTRSAAIVKLDRRDSNSINKISRIRGHICNLALAGDSIHMAVGTNNNRVKIYDLRRADSPYLEFTCFEAAVKALTWSPWNSQELIAGGGTADRRIIALNVLTGQKTAEVHTGSQVTGIHASAQENRFISCHGFSENISKVWGYSNDSFHLLGNLEGHEKRILHSALNADKTVLYTASEDETLKLWKIDKKRETKNVEKDNFEEMFNAIR